MKEETKKVNSKSKRGGWNVCRLITALLMIVFLLFVGVRLVRNLIDLKIDDILGQQKGNEKFKNLEKALGIEPRFTKKWEMFKNSIGLENLNICVGGVDPDTLSIKEYVKAFAEGPCAPTILVPALNGSWLHILIDCEILRRTDPDIFKTCGWNTCKKHWPIINWFWRSPKKEYRIWAPHPFEPFSILPAYKNTKKCFIGLFKPNFKISKDKAEYYEKPGVKILPIGATPETRSRKVSECGSKGIDNGFPFPAKPRGTPMEYLTQQVRAYEFLGFRSGLSFQPYPHDFRLSFSEGNITTRLISIVKQLNSLYGKKVAIFGHSLGNNMVVSSLSDMPQSLKDKAVARYIALGPPLLGVLHVIYGVVCFDHSFAGRVAGFDVGFTNDIKTEMLVNFGSYHRVAMQKTYQLHADKPYIKAILERTKSEESGKPMPKGTIMDIFPPPNATCVPFNKRRRTEKCHIGIPNDSTIARIEGKTFNPSQIEDMLKSYAYREDAVLIYKYYEPENDKFGEFKNPGVQTTVVYSSEISSKYSFTLYNNPKPASKRKEYYPPDEYKSVSGDGLVTTKSSLTPFIKWADEFRNGLEHSRPVKFVEACSLYNRGETIFDSVDQNGRKRVDKNSYIGAKCSCEGSEGNVSDGNCFKHEKMMHDPDLFAFILKTSIDGQKGEVGEEYRDQPESFFRDLYDNCNILNNGF